MSVLEADLAEDARGAGLVVRWIGISVAAFLIWAALAWVAEIVRAPGQVVSAARPQIVQNLEGGILAELSVAEGDVVEAGQVLARLQSTQYAAEADRLRDEIAALELRRARLEAEIAGRSDFEPPADLAARLPAVAASERALIGARAADVAARSAGAAEIMQQARAEMELLEGMLDRKLVPLIDVTRARKAFGDAEARHSDIVTQAALERAGEHAETLAKLAGLRQGLKAAEDKLERTVLRAPMRGVVNALSVTTIGGVVQPGQEIMQIIPAGDDLAIEARVKPRDIAQVRVGQKATVKLSAYDYTVWGTLAAEVTVVSADAFRDERARDDRAEPHYRVTLRIDPASLQGRAAAMQIRPGMQAEVELQTGGKTVLTYLVKPLWKSQEALRER